MKTKTYSMGFVGGLAVKDEVVFHGISEVTAAVLSSAGQSAGNKATAKTRMLECILWNFNVALAILSSTGNPKDEDIFRGNLEVAWLEFGGQVQKQLSPVKTKMWSTRSWRGIWPY